jgi:hypothetical protein
MLDWLDGMAGPEYTRAILWTLAALVLLVLVLLIIRLVRGLSTGTYVAGGRTRKTRLSVMDATAVDSHRRLVLVRRDDVEHLLLIGGSSDLVVERDIRLAAPRKPALTAGAPAPQPQKPAAAPQASPAPQRSSWQSMSGANGGPARHAPAVPAPAVSRSPPQESYDPIDDALLSELEVSLDDEPAAAKASPSLDDEMAKLLGELSHHKK